LITIVKLPLPSATVTITQVAKVYNRVDEMTLKVIQGHWKWQNLTVYWPSVYEYSHGSLYIYRV